MRTTRLGVVVVILAALASQAWALDFYVKVNGTKQGAFKGEGTGAQWKDWLPCVDLQYQVSLPLDRDTGLAAGMAQHLPLTIIKRLGAASPQFFQALTTNELLKQVDINLIRPRADGVQEVYYTITLRNANVIHLRLFRSQGQPDQLPAGDYEEISFRFQTATVSSNVGNTESTADWRTTGARGIR